MIKVETKGDFKNTESFLKRVRKYLIQKNLEHYGKLGVQALSAATPVDTGTTAESWYYKVEMTEDKAILSWHNSNNSNGIPIVVLIQYGHGTRNGGYVPPRDFINPALEPIINELIDKTWEEVAKT